MTRRDIVLIVLNCFIIFCSLGSILMQFKIIRLRGKIEELSRHDKGGHP